MGKRTTVAQPEFFNILPPDSDVVLKVEGVYKKFCRHLKRSMWYGTVDAARDMLGMPGDRMKLRKEEFWALQDIRALISQKAIFDQTIKTQRYGYIHY
jgi:hypothetical protein